MSIHTVNVARPNVIDIERCGASAERALEARCLVVKAHAIWHLHSFTSFLSMPPGYHGGLTFGGSKQYQIGHFQEIFP